MNLTDEQLTALIAIHGRLQAAQRRRYFDVLDIDPCADALKGVLAEVGAVSVPEPRDWSGIITVVK